MKAPKNPGASCLVGHFTGLCYIIPQRPRWWELETKTQQDVCSFGQENSALLKIPERDCSPEGGTHTHRKQALYTSQVCKAREICQWLRPAVTSLNEPPANRVICSCLFTYGPSKGQNCQNVLRIAMVATL